MTGRTPTAIAVDGRPGGPAAHAGPAPAAAILSDTETLAGRAFPLGRIRVAPPAAGRSEPTGRPCATAPAADAAAPAPAGRGHGTSDLH